MYHLLATPRGVTLAGVILAKRNSDGSFAVKGHEKYIHAQLQAAFGKKISPQAIGYIKRGCELLAQVPDHDLENAAYPFHPNPHAKLTAGNEFSDLTKGTIMFSLTGLNDLEDPTAGKERLLKIQRSPQPDILLKSLGLPTWEELIKDEGDDEGEDGDDDSASGDSSADDDDSDNSGDNGRYNPDEPRIPAGQPGAGQWTTGDGEYQVAQRTDVMTDARTDNGGTAPPTATNAITNDDGHVVIQYTDGSSEVRSDGSVAWRNNNPGNLRAGDFADNHGAIGEDANGFAIFPDEATGEAAQAALLNTPGYSQLTVDQAIARRSPNNENDTTNLQQSIRQISGLTGSERISDLTPEQFSSLTNAIRRTEGWRQGTAVTQGAQGQ